MKKNICFFILYLFSTIFAFGNIPKKPFDPNKEKKLLELIVNTLKKSHYNLKKIDDNFSKAVFKTFLDSIDGKKIFLLDFDYLELKKSENLIDNQILNNDLTFFYSCYDRIKLRMQQAKVIYETVEKNPIYLFINDSHIEYHKNFFKTNAELKEYWRTDSKEAILDTLYKKEKFDNEQSQINSKYVKKSFDENFLDCKNYIFKKINGSARNIENLERDYFFSYFIKAILAQIDPHTKYLTPLEVRDEGYNMSGQYVGLGTQVTYNDGFFQVHSINESGSIWREKKLEVGDIILKIAVGNDVFTDLVGLKLIDFGKIVSKAKKDIPIKLTIKKLDGTIKIVTIKKEIIEVGDTFAKSCIVEKFNKKTGIINLVKFYKDFSDSTNRDAAKDVAQEIEILKKEKIDGIIIDIRNNGGGSVETAIEIAGLFIKEGPIVQLKSNDKSMKILTLEKPNSIWDGPLTVLINSDTASASEMFAAAIQDYKRGIIIGSKSTFGKGTMQNSINLNQFIPESKTTDFDFGSLKTTIQQYFRITGNTTQIFGVVSDVFLPSDSMYKNYGEQFLPNVLLTEKVEKLDFKFFEEKYNLVNILQTSKKRIENNSYFILTEKKAKYLVSQKIDLNISLNYNTFKKNRDIICEDLKQFEFKENYTNKMIFKSSEVELKRMKKDDFLEKKRTNWHENLAKDIYIEEAINVLIDMSSGK